MGSLFETSSEAEFAVGAESDKFETGRVRFAVDENEIGPNVAIAVIVPFAGQRVIEVATRQRLVGGRPPSAGHPVSCHVAQIFLACSHAESGWCI